MNQHLHQVDHLAHHHQAEQPRYQLNSLQHQPYHHRTFRLHHDRNHQPYQDRARDRPSHSSYHGRPSQRDHRSAGPVQEHHQQHEGHGESSHSQARSDGRSQHPQYETNSRCQICSYTQPYPAEQKPVYHSHFSSLRLRELLGVEKSGTDYLCPSCKCSHGSSPEERIKVVLSDFSLHRFFAPPNYTCSQYVGDMIHVDYITIPEGCIEDLVHAFRLDYEMSEQNRPLDVLVVAGYNNILKNHSRYFIMEGLKHLSELVLNKEKNKNSGIVNTYAVASLMYPPRLAWFTDNGDMPYDYHDNLEKISWLNSQIHQLNVKNLVPDYPRFHTYGVRTDNRSRVDMYGYEHQTHTKSHRWEHWEEGIKTSKLNLKPARKFIMGTAVNKYFALNTP